MQPDTVIPDLPNPQSWNRYSYVTNRPVVANDPTGHYCVGDIEGCLDEVGGKPVNGAPLYLHSGNKKGDKDGEPGDDICTNYYECVPDCSDSEWGCSPDITWILEDWPAMTIAFAIPCLATGLCETIAVAGATLYDTGFWNTVAACLGNAICRLVTGMAGGAGSGSTINPNRPNYPGTTIPQSFTLTSGSGTYYVPPSATKHMAELASSGSAANTNLATQMILQSFVDAVDDVAGTGYNTQLYSGPWELVFSPSRGEGLLPAIIHAVFKQ